MVMSVKENKREILARSVAIDPGRLAFARQKHSDFVRYAVSSGSAGECDSFITDRPDVVLSIEVADCIPIFLYDRTRDAVGLVHAGWRGTASGITGKTVSEMVRRFGSQIEEIEAFLGPSIRACCYEMKGDVARVFSDQFVTKREGNKIFLDLAAANRHQLESSGLAPESIGDDSRCTFCDGAEFHSYRRDGPRAGRMLCVMGATES